MDFQSKRATAILILISYHNLNQQLECYHSVHPPKVFMGKLKHQQHFNVCALSCCLFVMRLPVDVDEGLAVHAVNVEDPMQVVHLMLEDTSWPSTGLPCDSFTLLIQTSTDR